MAISEQTTFVTTKALGMSAGEEQLVADSLDLIIGGDMVYVLVTPKAFRYAAEGELDDIRVARLSEAVEASDAQYIAFSAEPC